MTTATILTHARKIFLREKIFPFAVRVSRKIKARKPVKIRASCYSLALEKVLALYPKKFVKLKNSNMDLITAKVEAAAQSKKEKRTVYICVDNEGECQLSFGPPKGEVMAAYTNGSEIKLDEPMVADSPAPKKAKKVTRVSAEELAVIKENKESLRTVKKETPKKNSSKQKSKAMATTKKVAAKKTKANRPSVKGEKTVPRGNNMFLTPAEWKKVDAILEKEGVSFSAWSRGLVQAKIK